MAQTQFKRDADAITVPMLTLRELCERHAPPVFEFLKVDVEGAEVSIDLQSNALTMPNDERVSFTVEAFARYCLLNGVDEMGFLLQRDDVIAAYEARTQRT